jgi:hypothetical protein
MMDGSTIDQASKTVLALAPAFAAGFAVQQIIEIVDSVVVWRGKWNPTDQDTVPRKKAILSLISVGIATLLVLLDPLDFDVLTAIGAKTTGVLAERIVSIAFISAGTEGFNSLMKWLTYKKEDAKATAAKNKGGTQTVDANSQKTAQSLDWLPS